jgi:hypothetical protein
MRRYRPLLGEYLLWASQRPPGNSTNADGAILAGRKEPANSGTNPRLTSAKYTGYGIVLRAAVDTPDEISVFLQQIDKGPNYRWGFGNEGGCGDIYYYAGGKSYSGHLKEDAGDRRVTDAELTCNTGVYRDHTFRGIGMNELTEPFYDLEQAQFAELLPRQGADAYSWPEYGGRSVMLVGHDYIITYDVVNTMSRMSWNTVKGEDEMPTIIPIRGETAYRTEQTSTSPQMGTSVSQRFEPYKSGGDRMALISHRKDISVIPPDKTEPVGLTIVQTPNGTDCILEKRENFEWMAKGMVFSGRAGVIRRRNDGRIELALFHGKRIGTEKLLLEVENPGMGISASYSTNAGEAEGTFYSRTGGRLVLTLSANIEAGEKLYIDGAVASVRLEGARLEATLPAGKHRWQLTAGLAEPMPPRIIRSEATAEGAVLVIGGVPSAQKYRFEKSEDNGLSWTRVGETENPVFLLGGIKAPAKLHVRCIALNGERASRPGPDYPVYVTGRPPEPPSGLKLYLSRNQVKAEWGEVLGAKEYILSRRRIGETQWNEVYRGPEVSFTDRAPSSVAAFPLPGLEADAGCLNVLQTPIYEYTVSATDGNGQGSPSPAVDTNPASWRNWQPSTPLVFKRRSAYWLPPYVLPEQVPQAHYPE